MAAPDAPPTPFSMLLDFLKEKLGTQTGELIRSLLWDVRMS